MPSTSIIDDVIALTYFLDSCLLARVTGLTTAIVLGQISWTIAYLLPSAGVIEDVIALTYFLSIDLLSRNSCLHAQCRHH